MPLYMRMPKRGFNNANALKLAEVNLWRLQDAVDAGKLRWDQPAVEAFPAFKLADPDALQQHQCGKNQLARARGGRHRLEHAAASEHGVDRVRDQGAVALARWLCAIALN